MATKKTTPKTTTIVPLINIGIDTPDSKLIPGDHDKLVILAAFGSDRYEETKDIEIPIDMAEEFIKKGSAVRTREEYKLLKRYGKNIFRDLDKATRDKVVKAKTKEEIEMEEFME